MHDTGFRVIPLTVVSVLLIPVTVLIAELAAMRVPALANASAWIAMLSLVLAWAYGSWRRLAHIPAVCELVLIYTNVTIVALIYSYVTLRPALPLADASLSAADAWLGISVKAIVTWVDAYPALSWMLQKSYQSLGLQLGVIPVILAIVVGTDRAARMLAAQLVICIVGCTISIGWPAVGSFSFLGLTAQDLTNLNAVIGYHFHEGFFAARRDDVFALTIDLISGVSTFPSIHAALAILCAWALWPVRVLRYPALALNGFMYVSTIPIGAHYGVDVAAGTVLAAGSIWACSKAPAWMFTRHTLWRLRASPAAGVQA